MEIIIRACGERTEQKCIELASKQGNVHVIKAVPFGESIRQTYKMAMTFDQKWTPVIDADVLLHDNVLKMAIHDLNTKKNNVFCLDGKTKDKIMMKNRRAGIHIYRNEYLFQALKYINDDHIKPESNVRRNMEAIGFPTYTGDIVFGLHDFEQYYSDLWRKAVSQTKKLARMIKDRPAKWKRLSKTDKDFLIIYHANKWGNENKPDITIDKRLDFDSELHLNRLGIKEKGPLDESF